MSASTNAVQPVTIKTPDGAMPGTDSYSIDPYNGKDAVSNGGRLAPGDPSRRAFAYFMMGSARYVSLLLLLELCACFGRTAASRFAPLAVILYTNSWAKIWRVSRGQCIYHMFIV